MSDENLTIFVKRLGNKKILQKLCKAVIHKITFIGKKDKEPNLY